LIKPSEKGLLRDLVPFLAGFDARLLHGIDLEKSIQVALVAPGAIVVVVANLPGRRVDDGGIGPVGQPDDEARGQAAEELYCAEDRRRQLEAAASDIDCLIVADFVLDSDDVGQG